MATMQQTTTLLNPRFGTNADLKELIEEAHQRGIRVILDFCRESLVKSASDISGGTT